MTTPPISDPELVALLRTRDPLPEVSVDSPERDAAVMVVRQQIWGRAARFGCGVIGVSVEASSLAILGSSATQIRDHGRPSQKCAIFLQRVSTGEYSSLLRDGTCRFLRESV